MSIDMDASEARRMLAVCEREWRKAGVTPVLEDLVVRAISLALRDHSLAGSIGALLVAGDASDDLTGMADPAAKTFREAVSVRQAGGDADFACASWQVLSLLAQGIGSAMPRLAGGQQVGFALCLGRESSINLVAAYDCSAWSGTDCARLLARVREIFEAPYAMLV